MEEMWIQIMSVIYRCQRTVDVCAGMSLSNMHSFHKVYDYHKIHSLSTNPFLKGTINIDILRHLITKKCIYNESGLYLPFIICPAKPSTDVN